MNTKRRNDTPAAKVGPWTPAENSALVRCYLEMLALQNAGTPYSKTAKRNALIGTPDKPGPLAFRSHGSIECKLMNVSGCMKALGRLTVKGYLPAMNYQSSLMTALCEALEIKKENGTA
jgi:5-methylcytosine-specific restriction protein A